MTTPGVGASDFAVTATTGLHAATMTANALTPAEIVALIGAMDSASEEQHPTSCYR